jgi:hypothetical protein
VGGDVDGVLWEVGEGRGRHGRRREGSSMRGDAGVDLQSAGAGRVIGCTAD